MNKKPVTVAITGAGGNIGYNLAFRIAAGEMLGHDQPVHLKLLDLPLMINVLKGIEMELRDCAFPTLDNVTLSDDPLIAFKDADIALLVGAKPRSKGMERKDLLASNAAIFSAQGNALNQVASRDVKVLVVGNPANTNAWIAQQFAPDLRPENFTALMRLDHNRAISQLAEALSCPAREIQKVTVWGNHSATQYPDIFHATVSGQSVWPEKLSDEAWLSDKFIPTIQKRGGAILEMRGSSSVASAADATLAHMRTWCLGTCQNDWTTMGVLSNGQYDIPAGVIYGFPVTCQQGSYQVVEGLSISAYSRDRMMKSYQELIEEQEAVRQILNL